ncbi:hypothetical protein BDR26DRAFT_912331 [Obelidium mucronatum]|nr:hypothetical protein BDR26DRAFT_912331 [Obelidium mucronatum]
MDDDDNSVNNSDFRKVESIGKSRKNSETQETEYLVKWENSEVCSWVAAKDLHNAQDLVDELNAAERGLTGDSSESGSLGSTMLQIPPIADLDDKQEEEEVDELELALEHELNEEEEEEEKGEKDTDFVLGSDDENDVDELEDELSLGRIKRPKQIMRKIVERRGKTVYQVLWTDGSQTTVSAKGQHDAALLRLIEEYEERDDGSPNSSAASSDARGTRRSSRHSGATGALHKELSSGRRASGRNVPDNSSKSAKTSRKRALVEDSDEESQPEFEDYDEEDDEDDDEPSRRRTTRNRNEKQASQRSKEKQQALRRKKKVMDEDDEEDEEEEEDDEADEIEEQGAENSDVEFMDVDDDQSAEDGSALDFRSSKLRTHQDTCLRCGMGLDNNRRKDADLMGVSGDLLPCATCASQCHENCCSKPSRKDKERHLTQAQQLGLDVVDFQCQDCFTLGLPKCLICEKLPAYIQPEDEDDEDNDLAEDDENSDQIPQKTKLKQLHSDDITPLFRCQRCKLTAHLSCLTKKYPPASYKELENTPSSRAPLGTPAFYTNLWTCFECCQWNHDIDTILTFRDTVVDETQNGSDTVVGAIPATTREYYVKFVGVSHRGNEWVPGRWMEGQKTCAGKLGVFLRERVESWRRLTTGVEKQPSGLMAKPISEVVNVDWLRVDKILDIRMPGTSKDGIKSGMDIRKLELEDMEKVYVKWCGLGYDSTTWEYIPRASSTTQDNMSDLAKGSDEWLKKKTDEDMYPSFVEAFEWWRKRNSIGVYDKKRTSLVGKAKFTEYTKQPDFVKNGLLKDYQIDGLNWLLYKWTKGIPCILADEMGLGKTVQIVSFINALFTEHNLYPFIILAPSITIGHWLDEFRKWAPEIVAVHFTGNKTDRTMIRDYEVLPPKGSTGGRYRFHVLLANYELMMNESSLFKDIPFAALVCDEGHRLKNDESKTFRNLMRDIKVKHKVVLSGTPLQNNMRELFNLMNFLDSETWTDTKDLASRFGIENIKDDDSIIPKIHEYLRPYFLRRTKKEVLTFLPPKAEVVVPIQLTVVQKELYKAVLAKNFSLLRSIGVQGNGEKAAAPLKNILMELRKICNHPYLASSSNLEPPNATDAELHKLMVDACGKFVLLQPMLRKLKDTGHRVLLFSQFKIALDIIEDFLEGEGYKYQRIDGDTATSSRHAMITKFNDPASEDFIFLLTTRTGGTGINLTSADTVIIYDSDWNPHQDIQAVARVHRIGQTRPVLIYKLCTRDTIEESVLERSTSKLVLDKIVVGAMKEEDVNTKELSSVLKFGAKKLFEENNADDADAAGAKYDEAAVDKLLDRDGIIAEEEAKAKAIEEAATAAMNGDGTSAPKPMSFSFAKIWTHEVAEETTNQSDAGTAEAAVPADEQPSEQEDKDFWDKLLKDRLEQARLLEESAVLGKRQRKSVNYSERAKNAKGGGNDLDTDGVYEPDPDAESEDSASDFSEAEGGEGVVYDPLTNNPWLPWFQPSNNVDPLVIRGPQPLPNNHSLKCWLCLNPGCRYRTHCLKSKDVGFLKSLLIGLRNVIAKNEPKVTNINSIEFKIKIVQRLLNRAARMSDGTVPILPSAVEAVPPVAKKSKPANPIEKKAKDVVASLPGTFKLPPGVNMEDIQKFSSQLQSLKSLLAQPPPEDHRSQTARPTTATTGPSAQPRPRVDSPAGVRAPLPVESSSSQPTGQPGIHQRPPTSAPVLPPPVQQLYPQPNHFLPQPQPQQYVQQSQQRQHQKYAQQPQQPQLQQHHYHTQPALQSAPAYNNMYSGPPQQPGNSQPHYQYPQQAPAQGSTGYFLSAPPPQPVYYGASSFPAPAPPQIRQQPQQIQIPPLHSFIEDPLCWFCGQQGHVSESCHKARDDVVDNTCLEYLEAFHDSKKLKSERYNQLREFIVAKLARKQEKARQQAMRLASHLG